MSKKLLDNILHIYNATSSMNGTTTVSLEVDLDLPRGYIAHIKAVEIGFKKIGADIVDQTADVNAYGEVALVRDPDDVTTTAIPEESQTHDVIVEHETEVTLNVTEGSQNITPTQKVVNFTGKDVDVITARNMRLNCVAGGAQAALLVDSEAFTNIYFTLEKISNDQILQLLDIL